MSNRKRKTRKIDPVYAVSASISIASLTKAGSALTLLLEAQGQKLGELQIGRGSLFWWGRHSKKRKRIPWNRFAEILDLYA